MIERAAVVASGTSSSAILAWIADHGGRPEALPLYIATRGVHGPRGSDAGSDERRPLRYLLPAAALPELDESSDR